jgi:hypothetical protein
MFENAPLSKPETGKNASADDFSYDERKPFGKILMVSLAVIVLAAGVYFGFINRPAFLTRHNNVLAVDTVMADSKPEVIPETKIEPVSVAASTAAPAANNKYHIIAGAFVVEKNASNFIQQLQKNGYDPKVILKRNEYSFVSIFSFPTYKEANEKYHSLEDSGIPVWIMKY